MHGISLSLLTAHPHAVLCWPDSYLAVPPLCQILLFNLPVNFAQGTSIFWAYVVGFHEAPLTAIQVLYVNLVTVSVESSCQLESCCLGFLAADCCCGCHQRRSSAPSMQLQQGAG